jgi:SAM-dependent methyltransferase
MEFSLGRLAEGRKALAYLTSRYGDVLGGPERIQVLDVGCGNGGMLLPFAEAGHRCWGLDLTLHPELAEVAARAGLSLGQLQARGEALPFPDGSLDLVLLAETVEHVPGVRRLGAEVARVLRPGGLCYVTTPPRLRFLAQGDPHYGVPGLLLLPDGLQRFVFERWVAPGEAYDVTHVFWSAAGVMRALPGLELAEITSKNWAGPLRRLDWDWIVARKPYR